MGGFLSKGIRLVLVQLGLHKARSGGLFALFIGRVLNIVSARTILLATAVLNNGSMPAFLRPQ